MMLKHLEKQHQIVKKLPQPLAKDVLKIARRIEYASIFPPNTLDGNAKINTYL
jgi:taurine transport system permease protein